MTHKAKVAIIGAGISGLTIAERLQSKFEVMVFEKARGVGGRMSTRRDGEFFFDHGTQCFTARTEEFKNYVDSMVNEGHLAEWLGQVINLNAKSANLNREWAERHYVATPNMNSLCKHLAENLNVIIGIEVTKISRDKGKYLLFSNQDILGEFDILILTCPPEQALRLAGEYLDEDAKIRKSKLQACFATMIGFDEDLEVPYIAAKVHDSSLKWISVNSSKPMRDKTKTTFVLHSKNNWAEKNIDLNIEEIQSILIGEFEKFTSISASSAKYTNTHRWRYSIVEKTLKSGPYINHDSCFYASSDWCYTSRIEEVWIAANQLCDEIISAKL